MGKVDIVNILTFDHHDDRDHGDKGEDGTTKGKGNNKGNEILRNILLKFPFMACGVALVVLCLMIQNANRNVFAKEFDTVASKVRDAFFYETHMKTDALRDATVMAASIALEKEGSQNFKRFLNNNSNKNVQRLVTALEQETSQEIFQERNVAMKQFARIDQFTLYPREIQVDGNDHRSMSGCPLPKGAVRTQAIQSIQKNGHPVTSEAWIEMGEGTDDLKSTIFYPISMPGQDGDESVTAIGAVAADFKWTNFFSPTTFEGKEKEGMVIALENNLDQTFTFRVQDGQLAFVGHGSHFEEGFEDMVVTSNYANFVRPGGTAATATRDGVEACGCRYRISIAPSMEMYNNYASSWSRSLIVGAILTIFTLFLTFLAYDVKSTVQHNTVRHKFSSFYVIVEALFPRVVLDRVVDEAINLKQNIMSSSYSTNRKPPTNEMVLADRTFYLADCNVTVPVENWETVTLKPIYNTFPQTSIAFMDIAGFTKWCSQHDPEQVFKLLETTFQIFDQIASQFNVYKVETVGDCYVAATGLPEPQKDHCLLMVRFVYEAMVSFLHLAKALEKSLGPETGHLTIRAGIHSGPLTAGVIRAEKFRFQLFGDTMNVASRMESTGEPGRIQLSRDSALLLETVGKKNWVVEREDAVAVKGKGTMNTYWVKVSPDEARLVNATDDASVAEDAEESTVHEDEYHLKDNKQLIDFNTDMLLDLLRKVVARRRAIQRRHQRKSPLDYTRDNSMIEYRKYVGQRSLVDHVAEAIPFAPFEKDLEVEDPSKINLSEKVVAQARAYVEQCASLYNDVAFHNFDHASHVVMSANNLLNQIISPEKGGFQQLEMNANGGVKMTKAFHERTYGISGDPLMHFAAVQAALIHDVAHLGVTNKQLIKLNREMAARYDSRSVAEQHSLVMSMQIFADDKYKDLREALLANDPEETKRYYQFMISSVLATDIADKELKAIRQKRWDEAFEENKTADQVKNRIRLDDWYLGELSRIEWHFRVSSLCCVLLWLVLVYVAYTIVPEENIIVLDGAERMAEMIAFSFISCSYLYNALPYLLKVFDKDAEPMSGAVVGVITIKTFALCTNGIMALGFPTPVLIDPVMGTRVHLLRMCEWTPMAFLIYFISDGVDVPDKTLGVKAKYFFGLCQGVSTFFGYLFPFAPNETVWGFELFFSVVLYLTIIPHLWYKRSVFSRMERGETADDKEVYDRAQEALNFLETLWVTWSELVVVFLLEGFGPKISPLLNFTRVEGFGIAWMAFIDSYPKMKYVNHISKLHDIVFDTRARTQRQKNEIRRLQELSDKKATILFEYIIQASDVAHCMQHWAVYQKYNKRLFEEQYTAFIEGHTTDDPRPGWYKGEIWFFENYVIPLAQKLCDSGCFGASGAEYLRCATANLHEWKLRGEEVTAKMINNCELRLGDRQRSRSKKSKKSSKSRGVSRRKSEDNVLSSLRTAQYLAKTVAIAQKVKAKRSEEEEADESPERGESPTSIERSREEKRLKEEALRAMLQKSPSPPDNISIASENRAHALKNAVIQRWPTDSVSTASESGSDDSVDMCSYNDETSSSEEGDDAFQRIPQFGLRGRMHTKR